MKGRKRVGGKLKKKRREILDSEFFFILEENEKMILCKSLSLQGTGFIIYKGNIPGGPGKC